MLISGHPLQSRDQFYNNRRGPDSGLPPQYWQFGDIILSGSIQNVFSSSVFNIGPEALAVADAYTGFMIRLHALAQNSMIIAYSLQRKVMLFIIIIKFLMCMLLTDCLQVTVSPAFASLPVFNYTYTIYRPDFTHPLYSLGLPEFHVRVVSYVEGQATYHATYQRISSNEYAGGLTATYYSDPNTFSAPIFATPCCASTACEETIDFSLNSQATARVYGSGSVGSDTTRGWSDTENLPSLAYGVRWAGSISPTLSGLYTFSIPSAADLSCGISQRLDERVQLWIDDVLIIDQWTSLTSLNATGIFQFYSSYPAYYNISLTYKNMNSKTCSGLQLKWQNFNIANSSVIVPSIRLFPLSGRYSLEYTPTVSGDYQVFASLAQGFGLDATFYSDTELTNAFALTTTNNINFNAENQSLVSGKGSFSVRWAGLLNVGAIVNEAIPAVFTFEAGIAETDERLKLWVDNTLLIDRWDTYGALTATSFSATISLYGYTTYYDIKMEYKQVSGQDAMAILEWSCADLFSCSPQSIIPSSNFFLSRECKGSPFPPRHIYPAPTCTSSCVLTGFILSLGTAGVTDSFTLQAYDSYGNSREIGSDIWNVRILPFNTWDAMEPYAVPRTSQDCIGCPPFALASVEDLNDGSYNVSLAENVKGIYKV